MGHRLTPRHGRLGSPAEIAERLRSVFAHVHVDRDEGLAFAQNLARVYQNPPRISAVSLEESRAIAARLRSLSGDQALAIDVADDVAVALHFIVLEGDDSIFIGYGREDDEHALKPLVERCAQVLDCDLAIE